MRLTLVPGVAHAAGAPVVRVSAALYPLRRGEVTAPVSAARRALQRRHLRHRGRGALTVPGEEPSNRQNTGYSTIATNLAMDKLRLL